MFHSLVSSTRVGNPKWLAAWMLILALFSTAFAPGSVYQPVQSDSQTNDITFVLATNSEASTLDPALAYDTSSDEVIQNIYETLVFYNGADASSFVPQLASSYELSGDGLTWTFHIRQNVTFHNGAVLTPADVAYSFQRGLLQGGYSSPQWLLAEPFFGAGIDDIAFVVSEHGACADNRECMIATDPASLVAACQQVKAAVVADDVAGTVTMHLAQPWAPFLSTIAGTWGSILDKDWTIARGGWDGSCNTWQYWYAMDSVEDPLTEVANGTGPFKLDHWSPGQEIVLTRNNSYWRTPAQLQNIVIQIVPDDTTRFTMLQAGSADEARPVGNRTLADEIVGEDCPWNINSAQYECLNFNAAKSLRRYTGRPSVTQNHVLLNFDIAVPQGGNPYIGSGQLDGNGIPSDFFSDLHVRKAFNYCFNWDTYNQVVHGGEFIQGTTLALEGMPGYDLNSPHYTFDLAACEAELALADLDHDGIPSASDTNDVTQVGFHFKLPYNAGNLSLQTIMEILAGNFSQVNPKFVIDVVSLPRQTFLQAQSSSQLPVMTGGWHEDIHDPHNWYQPFLVGTYSYRAHIPTSLRAQFTTLINQGVSTSDFAARHAVYQQLNQLVYNNAPLILLGGAANHDFIRREASGRVLNQAYPGNYYYPISINDSHPAVSAITRSGTNPTNASSVTFNVVFSETVTGVNATAPFNDFALYTTDVTGASIIGVNGSGATRTVTVNTGSGNGTIRLDVPGTASVQDLTGNPLNNLPFTSGQSYSVVKTTVFADVPLDHMFWKYIEAFYDAGLTTGCSPAGQTPKLYCPYNNVTRAEMAVFLERAMGNSAPTPSSTGMFSDVLGNFWAAKFIEEFYNDGITTGCANNPLRYCPNNNVTRQEMAVFIERALGNFTPAPNPSGNFSDVPYPGMPSTFPAFIDQFYNDGITTGCAANPLRYCPLNLVTRQEMAVFIVRAFGIPLP